MLAEVLLCTKEVNKSARFAAFDLLASIGDTIHDLEGGEGTVTLEQYVSMVAAGLAGKTAHMLSATVLALAKVLYQVVLCIKTLRIVSGRVNV